MGLSAMGKGEHSMADTAKKGAAAAAAAAGAKAEEAPAAAKAEKVSKKAPKPEGWVSPVEFAKELAKALGQDVRPQVIYGYIKNNKGFGQDPAITSSNTDGHVMVNLQAGLAYLLDAKAKRAEAKSAKAAAAAAAAAPAAPTA
jgi:hypothetical protein